MQARYDDVIKCRNILPKMRKSGNLWIMMGLESNDKETLKNFRKDLNPSNAKQAMNLLKKNDIFSQATLIIGDRKDSHESIDGLRKFVNEADPDLAIFMTLTPFP